MTLLERPRCPVNESPGRRRDALLWCVINRHAGVITGKTHEVAAIAWKAPDLIPAHDRQTCSCADSPGPAGPRLSACTDSRTIAT